MNTITIEKKGYEPVECDTPLPCPFCGSEADLRQAAYTKSNGERIHIVYSSRTLKGEKFWFQCKSCRASTGNHQTSAQAAVELWNKRYKGDA